MADGKTLTIFDDGPIEVYGPLTVADEHGKTVAVAGDGEPIYLCRCGGSTTKPLCDGTHSKIGFAGAMKAVAETEA
jgi:CDGSH-type Zn-finger protein